jgi:2-dehydropantoate 2-reductase
MRVAIYGTGGAGGYFGAQLAGAGEDVTFVARGQHLKAIQAQGYASKRQPGKLSHSLPKPPTIQPPSGCFGG